MELIRDLFFSDKPEIYLSYYDVDGLKIGFSSEVEFTEMCRLFHCGNYSNEPNGNLEGITWILDLYELILRTVTMRNHHIISIR